jgi:archaellum biogenesis protein FlaJ (TadC family)
MKKTTLIVGVTLLATLFAFVVCPFWLNQVAEPLTFKPLTPQLFAGLIGWLFAVSLFVERAVEVVVLVFRDQQADALVEAEARANAMVAALAGSAGASQTDKDKAAKDAATARGQSVTYRTETKEMALLVGFAFGIFVSLAGVRALHGLLADSAPTGTLFTVADILVTGAMLAGGSEGIHRMANAFTSFMDSLSSRADASQKRAEDSMKANP